MPADLAQLLRAGGHDVADVLGENLGGRPDQRVLDAATKEHRVPFTFDLDFADIRKYPPGTHAGIVVFRLRDQHRARLERPVGRLLAQGTLENLSGGLAIVDESRTRIKRSRK